MNHLEKRQRKIHPIESTNIICKCLFIYTLKIFRKNFQKDNADEEMYEVPSNYESKNINDQLETKWNGLQENRQNVSVARLLLSCYGLTFFLLGLFKLITSIIMLVVQPYATAKLVSYFAPNTNLTKKDAYFYAAILIGLKLSNSIVTHNYYLLLAGLGIKISTALCTLVYKRILKMKQFHFQNIGQVVTVITKDVNVVKKFINYGNDTWIGITQAVVLSFVLYRKIGLAALIGMTFLWLSLLLQIYIVIKIFPSKKKMCEKTDERYKIVQEALSSIKLIRMYVWEKFFEEKISQARTQEVNATRKIFVIKLVGSIINTLNTNITLYILLMSYLIFGNNITAEVVFYTVTCCDLLETGLTQMFLKALYVIAELIICIKRIENLLTLPNSGVKQESKNDSVVLSKIHFNNTVLRIENKEIFRGINLTIQKGLILITGYVNSGKTSLLKLILQEYEPESGNLQIQGSVSYASQEPWLFPSTIRQNILFGEPYNEMRYQKVLQVCALTYDLELFDYGDLTIIEDQGFNLSKGQQIRINLARAVYQQAEIYLLDDCLTGLDAKVGRFIFKECIQKFLQEKMVILVTNDTNYLKCANNVIIVNNSELKSITNNPITKIAESDDESKTRENSYLADTNEDEESTENSLLIGKKKVYQENNKVGKLDSDVYVRYIKFAGGFFISILVFCVFIATEFFIGYKMKVISKWVNLEEEILNFTSYNPSNESKRRNVFYLYSSIIIVIFITTLMKTILFFLLTKNASINLHKEMLTSVLNTSIEFFDKHFIGNILNRFSEDFIVIDENIPAACIYFLQFVMSMGGIIGLMLSVDSSVLIPVVIMFALFIALKNYYLETARQLKRLKAALKSPIVGYMNTTQEGLMTIRAANVENILINEFHQHQNLYVSTSYTLQCCTSAFTFILEILCVSFIAAIIIIYLVTEKKTVGNVGLVISQAIRMTAVLQRGARRWVEVENYMTSVERVLQYIDTEKENKFGLTLKNWPERGEIKFQNVSLIYNNCEQPTLRKINFMVKPNEKIGIVGRTGAGKSSLISIFFRLYKFQGRITIDDVDIKTLSLEFLRSKISVIPQDALVFTGTIRDNVDPTCQCTDEEIWHFLKCVHLDEIIPSLDFKIVENGQNFSAGQKQLICVARALARKNKIVILDEATANLDPENDVLVHNVIEKHFAVSTVLIIAHKLQSVLKCNKVIVLEKGVIVEFGKPTDLLRNENGPFYKLVQKAGLLNIFLERI